MPFRVLARWDLTDNDRASEPLQKLVWTTVALHSRARTAPIGCPPRVGAWMDISVALTVALAALTTSAVLVTLASDIVRVRRPLRYWLTM